MKTILFKSFVIAALSGLLLLNVTISNKNEQAEITLTTLEKIAQAQSEGPSQTYQAHSEVISYHTNQTIGPHGGICITTGKSKSISCYGVGDIVCSPSITWLEGPTKSGDC